MSKNNNSHKLERITSEILNILNHALKYVIYDDWIKKATFTYVELDKGMGTARVYVDTFKREEIEKLVNKLNESKGIFRSELAKNLRVWKAPNIVFIRDETIDRVINIEKALIDIKNKK